MLIEVFIFNEELFTNDLTTYTRVKSGVMPTTNAIMLHPNDRSWNEYFTPIKIETLMYKEWDMSFQHFKHFSIVEIDNDILCSVDSILYSFTEIKRRDLVMGKFTFGYDNKIYRILDRELKLKMILTL
jgi:hypothetical protein